ncbi:16631_t:CDS:2, partial [Racocetra persica]
MHMKEDTKLALSHFPHFTNETEFVGCAKTPPSWLIALHHYEGDKKHVHDFFLSKHFIDGPETVLICKKCHKRFTLTTSSLQAPTKKTINQMNVKRGMCIANQENNLHHLHTIISTNTDIASQCCYCNFTVFVVIQEPYIGIQIFDELQKTRPIPPYSKTAKKTNGVKNESNIIDTLELLSNIIKVLTIDASPR